MNTGTSHIYPFAAIPDKNDLSQILAVCNWGNLQPLTATANLKKGDIVTPEAKALQQTQKEFNEEGWLTRKFKTLIVSQKLSLQNDIYRLKMGMNTPLFFQ